MVRATYTYTISEQTLVNTFEVCDVPVRAAKFLARKSWVLTGSDDMCLRAINYNTHEVVATVEAHADYIRSIAVHPTLPLVLTSSDDMTIKCWDWDKNWRCIQASVDISKIGARRTLTSDMIVTCRSLRDIPTM